MSQKYRKKQPSGREYVDKTIQFCDTTHLRCDLLPERWNETLLYPLLRDADEIETNVCMANRVYIARNMEKESLIHAYRERDELLETAVRLFSDFDIKFERLMGRIDLAGSEKKRLNQILCQIIREEQEVNPCVRRIDIHVTSKPGEMEYTSLSGEGCMKLKMTAKNRDYWLRTENDALNGIRSRIQNDKKAISKLNAAA